MRATTESLEGNKIRLSVEVDAAEVDRAVDDVVRSLSRQARVPGFRPGKVPRRVLEARMGGSGALREEALREALPDFYAQAVVDVDADPIAPPEIELTSGEQSGPLAFEATVEVRPVVAIPGYAGLEVTVPSPEVGEEDIQAQIDRLRETDAELEPVERPAQDGDHVTIDLHGTDQEGAEVTGTDDFLYEVGSASVVPELDQELRGASVGNILSFQADGPSGTPVSFRVLVKRVQKKVLPELSDEWVAENTESATATDLREEMEKRMAQVKVLQARLAMRDGALSALAKLVDDEVVPTVLVDEELGERVRNLEQRLEAQGASLQEFLEATGRSAEDLVGELREEATQGVKVDLALRALADAEDLEVSDEELDQEVAETAERLELSPEELRRRLDRAGRTGAVRSEQRKAKALTWLLDHVDLVDEDGKAVARETLEMGAPGSEGDDESEVEGEGGDGGVGDVGEEASETSPVHGTVTVAAESDEEDS